jgi:uncharacterized cupin superfamily protein
MSAMRAFNVFDAPVPAVEDEPDGYKGGEVEFREQIGARTMTGKVYELPPGQALCPYHWETNEEWMLVLQGRIKVRHPHGEDELGPGDVVAFPAGPDGAHKTTAVGDETARVVFFATFNFPAIAIYPDSDKLAAWTGDEDDYVLVRRGSRLAYYDGELG